jgi:hypothetical protein
MRLAKLKLSGLAMGVVISVAGATSAHAQPISSRAMVALSAKAADTKAKRDLLSILQPAGKFRTGNRITVSGAYMRTLPHGSTTKGLCAMDVLALHYETEAARAKPMDEPLHPVSLDVAHLYHAVDGVDYMDDRYPTDRAKAVENSRSRDCEKLRSDKTAVWFEAETSAKAVEAVNALHAATDALRAGRLEAKGCDYPLQQGETCSQAIQRVARTDKITDLVPDCEHGAGQSCVELFLDDEKDMALIVVFSLKNNSPEPEDVIEVKAGVYVTVD